MKFKALAIVLLFSLSAFSQSLRFQHVADDSTPKATCCDHMKGKMACSGKKSCCSDKACCGKDHACCTSAKSDAAAQPAAGTDSSAQKQCCGKMAVVDCKDDCCCKKMASGDKAGCCHGNSCARSKKTA